MTWAEQVERGRDLGQARHDHAGQAELTALQFLAGWCGGSH